jgi:hypothetical protein
MTRCATLVIATVVSAIALVQYAGPASSQDGWITLFDGKNLDQWEAAATPEATYAIEDGSVVAHKKDPKATVNLVSKQSFKDFELRAEFWVSDDANSGIYIRCTDPASVSSKTAYEVNIYDTRPDPSYGTGAIPNVAKAMTVLKTGGKWNTYEITAKGPSFTLVLNGVKTVDNASDSKFPEGRIAIQYGVGTVKFRKVQIKPL